MRSWEQAREEVGRERGKVSPSIRGCNVASRRHRCPSRVGCGGDPAVQHPSLPLVVTVEFTLDPTLCELDVPVSAWGGARAAHAHSDARREIQLQSSQSWCQSNSTWEGFLSVDKG